MQANPWNPLWMREHDRTLYAALHPAQESPSGLRAGVVLVPPLLHEMPRGRRLATQIAERLAAAGLTCLRFDFYGTGDSEGSGAAVDFDSMSADLDLAIATLRAVDPSQPVALLAIRGGALVVGRWMAQGRHVDTLALWEPIDAGDAWLEQLQREDAAQLQSADRYPGRRGVPVPAQPGQLMGLDVSSGFIQQLQAATLKTVAGTTQVVAVLRDAAAMAAGVRLQHTFNLPADTASFAGTRMDGAMFVTPRLQPMLDDLARAIARTSHRQASAGVLA